MSELRLDPLTGRWVVISTERAARQDAFRPPSNEVEPEPRPCPFCHHNEQPVHQRGQVMVLPNRYPCFEGDAPMAANNNGPVFTSAPGSGRHEVVVMSQDHDAAWPDLPPDAMADVMSALASRMVEHGGLPGLRYSQAIINHGREAGASVAHPHAQLLALPFVPERVKNELAGFARFEGGCPICATAEAERVVEDRVVLEGDGVVVVCPYWSSQPYEMLVIPETHLAHLPQSDAAVLAGVGWAIGHALGRLRAVVGNYAYNVIFHTAPYRADRFHWHVHIVPKLTTPAGFEMGTGVPINIMPPEVAAARLREAIPSVKEAAFRSAPQ